MVRLYTYTVQEKHKQCVYVSANKISLTKHRNNKIRSGYKPFKIFIHRTSVLRIIV